MKSRGNSSSQVHRTISTYLREIIKHTIKELRGFFLGKKKVLKLVRRCVSPAAASLAAEEKGEGKNKLNRRCERNYDSGSDVRGNCG